MGKDFIPKNKPKSWVVGICAGLLGMLVFGPLGFLAAALEFRPLSYLAIVGFIVCWCAFAAMWLVFAVKFLSGRYRDLPARDWKEQVW